MDLQNIIIINGNEFSFEPGESILDIARRNSIDIPTLCHLKGATPTGACRVCVVEVEGARSLVASCAAPAANNMVVRTESASVIAARRMKIRNLVLPMANKGDFDELPDYIRKGIKVTFAAEYADVMTKVF